MHEPYDDNNDDEDYDDHNYDYDYQNPYEPYKFYFQFDVGNTSLSDWLEDMINKWIGPNDINSFGGLYDLGIVNIPGFPAKKFPVNSWNPDTGKDNAFQYLGSNYQNSPIWKKKYFVVDKINAEYKLHIQSHVKHFVSQPTYYSGLFDILN